MWRDEDQISFTDHNKTRKVCDGVWEMVQTSYNQYRQGLPFISSKYHTYFIKIPHVFCILIFFFYVSSNKKKEDVDHKIVGVGVDT